MGERRIGARKLIAEEVSQQLGSVLNGAGRPGSRSSKWRWSTRSNTSLAATRQRQLVGGRTCGGVRADDSACELRHHPLGERTGLPRRTLHGAGLAGHRGTLGGAVRRLRVHLRDLTQEWLGRKAVIVAILVGALLSWVVTSNRVLAVFSKLADFTVYQPLRERRWLLAVFASNVVGLVIDSILFLQIALGSLDFIEGEIIGKLWTTVFAVVVLLALRRWVIPRYSRPADEPTVPEIA
jgi:hypothetical protein